MSTSFVLIIGAGHLAHRISQLAERKGYTVSEVEHIATDPGSKYVSTLDSLRNALEALHPEEATMIYVLFEKDQDNQEMVIALMALYPEASVCTALFNENIRPHLESANPKLRILNPARIAAPSFINALDLPASTHPTRAFPDTGRGNARTRSDYLVHLLIGLFGAIFIFSTCYFHYREHLSWIDSLYFVVVTVSTVGYGDFNLQSSGALSKIVGMFLILSSSIFIWVIFSLLIGRIIKLRVDRSLGIKKYHYKNHIILCGLGRLGYFIAEMLQERSEKVVIVELEEDSHNPEYFRGRGMDVYNGDARLPRVLQDAGAASCRALICVINNDYVNLEIALNARHFQPELRLILRIFDASMAEVIREKFDIHLTQSMSAIAAEKFAAQLPDPITS